MIKLSAEFENKIRPTWGAYTLNVLAEQIERHGWEIGDFTYGTPQIHEAGFGHLRIGRFCSIATGVNIVLSNCQSSFVTTYPFSALNSLWEHADSKLADHRAGSVDIGNDVWIGLNACILPGTTVGDGCIIRAGAVVSGVVQPYSIVSGNAATIRRKRFNDQVIERLLAAKWWELPVDAIDALIPMLVSDDIEAFLNQVEAINTSSTDTPKPSLKGALVRCVEAWGEKTIVSGIPSIEVITGGAWYVPQKLGMDWGIFDGGGSAVAGSLDFHGPNHTLKRNTVSVGRQLFGQTCAGKEHYVYGGVINPHFGHFLVNTLPRLWPLSVHPLNGRKLLVHAAGPKESWFAIPFIGEILSRIGLTIDDFVQFSEATFVQNLTIPHPAFQEQTFAHIIFGELCRKIGSTIDVQQTNAKRVPVYLSKTRLRSGVGRFINEDELVRSLKTFGVKIIYPETLSFAEQVGIFSDGAVVAGGSGSALHAGIFSSAFARIIAINPMNEVNSNFLMLDDLGKHKAEYYYPLATSVIKTEGDKFITSVRLANPQRTAMELMQRIQAAQKAFGDTC